jgi:molecular chaperone DnaK (HSP70)
MNFRESRNRPQEGHLALQRLKEAAERAKIELSVVDAKSNEIDDDKSPNNAALYGVTIVCELSAFN